MTHHAPVYNSAAIRRAVILSFFGNAAFSAQYALMQMAGQSVSAPMIIAVNATLLLLVVGAVSLWRGHKLYFKTAYPKQQTWRCLLRVAANAMGIWALLHIPLTTHIVLGFLSPLLVAIIGPLLLREARVQKALVSVALGLAGMFIILSVETAPLVPLLVAFAGVVIGSLNGILVRTMPRDHPFTFMLYTNIFLALAFWPFAIADVLAVSHNAWLLMLGAAVFATFSNYTYFRANLLASPQYTSPLTYTQLIWGAGLGWLTTRHVPDEAFWLGAALIIVGSFLLLPRPKKPI